MSELYINYPERSEGQLVYPAGPPREIICDTSYEFTVRVVQKVSSGAPVNFKKLYEHAEAAGRRRVGRSFCPARCGPSELKQIARRWGWRFDGNDQVAFVDIRFRIECPPRRTTKGLGPPDPEDFKPGTFNPGKEIDKYHVEPKSAKDEDFDKGYEDIKLDIESFSKLPCPGGARVSQFHYWEQVDDCRKWRRSDADYIRRATQAAIVEATMRAECEPRCHPVVGVAPSTASTCSDGGMMVEVVLTVVVVCVP